MKGDVKKLESLGNPVAKTHGHTVIGFDAISACDRRTDGHAVLCLKKVSHLMFANNFGKCRPIFKILLPIDSLENSMCINKHFHLTCSILLHYLVKVENPKLLSILTASSTNC